MDAKAYELNIVLREKQQWVVPVYQRHYEWESEPDKQIPKLWEDLQEKTIEQLDANRKVLPHYFGAIIYSEPETQSFGTTPKRFLVDGQQRITTFELVVSAIREVAREKGADQLVKVANTYIFNEASEGMEDKQREIFKLWPSAYDRELFQKITASTPNELRDSLTPKYFAKNGNLKKNRAPKLLKAYWYLYEEISKFVTEWAEQDQNEKTTLNALTKGFLSGFRIVVIQLDAHDDAQEIFASLNGMAKPLSAFDLIRNDVFHRARKQEENDQEIFERQWQEFEKSFWTKEVRQGRYKRARADHLVAHAVIAETAREVNIGKIATEYQHYARERKFDSITDELAVLLKHAQTYRSLEDVTSVGAIGKIGQFFKIWDLSTFHPLALWIGANVSHERHRKQLFDLIETYIVRREICRLTTKNYNQIVPMFIREMQKSEDPINAFLVHLNSLTGDVSRMPDDKEVSDSIARKSIYGPVPQIRIRYILQQFEYELRSKFDEATVSTDNLTIEHVMPQTWSTNWPLPNGKSVQYESNAASLHHNEIVDDETKKLREERGRVIDTLGNLTLVTEALNPSLSNAGWPTKKERLSQSLLAMNRDIAAMETWDEQSIDKRAIRLASIAVRRWRYDLTLVGR